MALQLIGDAPHITIKTGSKKLGLDLHFEYKSLFQIAYNIEAFRWTDILNNGYGFTAFNDGLLTSVFGINDFDTVLRKFADIVNAYSRSKDKSDEFLMRFWKQWFSKSKCDFELVEKYFLPSSPDSLYVQFPSSFLDDLKRQVYQFTTPVSYNMYHSICGIFDLPNAFMVHWVTSEEERFKEKHPEYQPTMAQYMVSQEWKDKVSNSYNIIEAFKQSSGNINYSHVLSLFDSFAPQVVYGFEKIRQIRNDIEVYVRKTEVAEYMKREGFPFCRDNVFAIYQLIQHFVDTHGYNEISMAV